MATECAVRESEPTQPFDVSEFGQPYPLGNVLRQGPNTSKLPVQRVSLRGLAYAVAIETVLAAIAALICIKLFGH